MYVKVYMILMLYWVMLKIKATELFDKVVGAWIIDLSSCIRRIQGELERINKNMKSHL